VDPLPEEWTSVISPVASAEDAAVAEIISLRPEVTEIQAALKRKTDENEVASPIPSKEIPENLAEAMRRDFDKD
jgi:hypothetical protein